MNGGAEADIFDALISMLTDTCREPDLQELLWSVVNLSTDRIEGELDANGQAQQRNQQKQGGAEIRSVEPETLAAEGMTLIERRNGRSTVAR